VPCFRLPPLLAGEGWGGGSFGAAKRWAASMPGKTSVFSSDTTVAFFRVPLDIFADHALQSPPPQPSPASQGRGPEAAVVWVMRARARPLRSFVSLGRFARPLPSRVLAAPAHPDLRAPQGRASRSSLASRRALLSAPSPACGGGLGWGQLRSGVATRFRDAKDAPLPDPDSPAGDGSRHGSAALPLRSPPLPSADTGQCALPHPAPH
jgi:hypothetical protein